MFSKLLSLSSKRVSHLYSNLRNSFWSSESITTWSPLANAFNTKPAKKTNIFRDDAGLFCIRQLNDPGGFYLLKDGVMARTSYLISETLNSTRDRKMVDIFDDLSDTLCRVADMAEFIRVAHPKADYNAAAEYACTNISALVENLNTNTDLYKALKNVVQSGDNFPTDDVDQHVAKLFLFDFEQSGIHLDEDKRHRVVALNEHILQIGSLFVQNCYEPKSVPKKQLPADIRRVFPVEGESASVAGLHAESNNERIREAAYKTYLYPNENQERLFSDLLRSRHELAQLCGFPTFAHRALRNSLAGEPEMVMTFLNQVSKIVREPAAKNFAEMSRIKKKVFNSTTDLKPWDVPYFTSYIKNEKFRINVPDYTPYFSIGACMDGLNMVLSSIFDINLVTVNPEPGELWHPDVYKLAVLQKGEGLLGYVYCDFFERPRKPNQDCHFTIQGGRLLEDSSYQMPVVVLLLNFPQPTADTPSLLSPGMMENLFHEMGHAMHSMLARTKHQHVTGTRCSTDFAEVPSILMEYFANDPRVLSKFSRHYKTGEPLPMDMIHRLCNSKNMFSACELQLQIFYSIVDQIYHRQPLGNKSSTEVMGELQNKYYGLPHEPNTAWQLRFNHFVGYGAKYYSYLMARAVASLIWQQCFKNDPFNKEMGYKYSLNLLAHGGGKPAKELIEAFFGSKVTPEILSEALKYEIEVENQLI